MSQSILKVCDRSNIKTIAKGTELMTQGHQSGALYVLESGTIDIQRDGLVVASTSEPGSVFGEMSILLGTPHTATVRAKTACQIYVRPSCAPIPM
jgi:CRP-like cAMP-binding protein